MKYRITRIAGQDIARFLWMGTFHSIFAKILRMEGELLGYKSSYTIYDSTDSRSLIRSIIRELNLDDNIYKTGVAAARISNAKNNLVTANMYAASAEMAELDKATRSQLERGQRITEILKQPLYQPVAMEKQVIILFAAINGLLDDVPIAKMREFEAGLYKFMDAGHPEIGNSIAREKDINDAISEALKGAVQEFKKGFK